MYCLCFVHVSLVAKRRVNDSRIIPIFLVSAVKYIIGTEYSNRGNVLDELLNLNIRFAKFMDFSDVLSVWGGYETSVGSYLKWCADGLTVRIYVNKCWYFSLIDFRMTYNAILIW